MFFVAGSNALLAGFVGSVGWNGVFLLCTAMGLVGIIVTFLLKTIEYPL